MGNLGDIDGQKLQMVLLIGIPASGKSTFATMHLSADYQRISLDLLKKRAREAKVFSDAIAKRRSVVIDNTNVTRAERRRFIEPARAAGYEVIGYFFQSVLSDCLQRNALRIGKARIPDVGVIARSNALEMPSGVFYGADIIGFSTPLKVEMRPRTVSCVP